MKVLLKQNVSRLGRVGDLVDVKPGYARNYLLPQHLAVAPTEANIRAVEAEKEEILQELAKQQQEVEARAMVLRGKEVTLVARANEEGQLYGSIGPAQIVAVLAEQELFVEAENIVLDEPIRQLDKYDIEVRLAEDVSATIHVWVVPAHDDDDEAPLPEDAGEAPLPEDAGEAPLPKDAGEPVAEPPAAEPDETG